MARLSPAASLSTFLWEKCEKERKSISSDNMFLNSLATVTKLVMSLAIFFSYALQFYVPVDIINPYIQPL